MKVLVLISLLLLAVWCEDLQTTINFDPVGTNVSSCKDQLKRVEKKVDVRFQYLLTNNDQWTQFPNMIIEFYLPLSQYITFWHNFVIGTDPATHLAMRTIIDGVEDISYRFHTGMVPYHNHFMFDQIWMEKGRHVIKIQYRSPGNRLMNFWDWNCAVFKIRYYTE